MRAGSVVVDLAAGPLGGNVEGSVPDETVVTGNGVTVIGAGNLASETAPAASTAYARNIAALLAHLIAGRRAGHRPLRRDPARRGRHPRRAVIHPRRCACCAESTTRCMAPPGGASRQ